jgi:hypothetical protein
VSSGDRSNADHLIVAALAAGSTNQDAAATAGVNERTVRRRLEDPAFRAQVDEARRAAIDLAVARLSDSAAFAATTLRQLAEGAQAETVRLGACRTILELGLKWREHGDLTARIEQLERGTANEGSA